MMTKKTLLASVLSVAGFALTTSVVAGNNLADRHAQNGLECAQCHVEKVPSKAPKMDTCLECHDGSYEELGKALRRKSPIPTIRTWATRNAQCATRATRRLSSLLQ